MNPQTTIDPGDPRFAGNAIIAYEQASSRFLDCCYGALDARDRLNPLRDAVRDLEAAVMANGGLGELQITGSNEKAREASLRTILAGYPAYRDAVALVRQAERALAEAEGNRDDASNDMRGARLRIEFSTSWNYRQAAAEGRAGEKGTINHGH